MQHLVSTSTVKRAILLKCLSAAGLSAGSAAAPAFPRNPLISAPLRAKPSALREHPATTLRHAGRASRRSHVARPAGGPASIPLPHHRRISAREIKVNEWLSWPSVAGSVWFETT